MQFEDLKAWQKARELTNGIYQICKATPLKNDFGLRAWPPLIKMDEAVKAKVEKLFGTCK
jgi:hypothetical protein